MNETQTTKSQTKPSVDREAVRVLAIELGAREAARRLGLNPNTVLSWAKRDNWELPNRKGGATKASANAITLQSKPGDVLIATHKELETKTKTALMQTVAKAAQLAARKSAFDVTTTGQLRDLALTMAKLCGWDGKPSVTYYGDDNRTLVVCDEARRRELIEQRQRLLEAESNGKVIEIEAAASVTLPAEETQSNATAGTGDSIVAQDPSPATPQDAVSQHMESIRTAATWKPSEPEHHYGSFAPHPEELE
jgi:hypothetical protein